MISRRAHTQRSSRPNPAGALAVLAVAVLGVLTACGGSDDDTGSDAEQQVDETTTDADAGPTPTDTDGNGEVDAPASGSGSGTLTLGDGTSFTFVLSTCDTSENGADGFVLPDTYDLFGATADGAYRMQLIRAGLDEDFVVETATLETDFDEDGNNAGVLYTRVVDTLALTVDGGNVAGTVMLTPIGPNRPFGDEIEATVAVSC